MDKKNIDYFRMYDFLYRHGYHSKGKNHGVKYVKLICDSYHFDSILEVGCSQGLTVGKFLKHRVLAYGIDVSLDAIKQATGKKYNIPNCIQASAIDIPFVDNFVDAVFTCDVLEHLTEEDVYKALDEIERISRRYLFIVIDDQIEGNQSWIEFAKEKYSNIFKDIDNLHLTVRPVKWWRTETENRGYKLIKKIRPDENSPYVHCYEKI